MNNKGLIIGVVIVVIAILIGAGAWYALQQNPNNGGGGGKKVSITIYTGGTSGVYFPLGSKYAELLNKYSNDIDAKAVTSGASVSNAKAIGDGNAQAALIQNDVAYYAYKGLYMFKDHPVSNIRGVAALYPETVQFVVLANSGIHSLSDLQGKKVAIGATGSGTAVAAEQILRAVGVWDSIQKVNQKFSEAAQSLKLGQVDAAVIVSGAPTPAVNQIAVQTPVRVLPIPDDVLNKLHTEGYIFYVRQNLPKSTYNGMEEDTPTVAVKAMLVVSSKLSDNIVYEMTKILFDHVDELRSVHEKAKYISKATALDGMSIPLHPGAKKYYSESRMSITIYTGGTSGVYFPLGSKYAELLNKYSTTVTAKAVTSGASVSNAKAIGDGNAQAALIQNDVAYYAYKGLYMFKDHPVSNIRGVAALYPETVQFVVLANSGIHSLSDLQGKKVAIGATGSGTAVAAEQILRAVGVWDSIQKVNQKFSEAAQSLKLGQVDAAVIVSGAPTPAVNQIAVQTPVRVLPIPDDVLNKLHTEGYIFYVRQNLPKSTYNGMEEDTPTVAVKAMLVVSASLPDYVVYDMVRVLYAHVNELRAVHEKAKYISLETALEGMSIPLHKGAKDYYEHNGIIVPSSLGVIVPPMDYSTQGLIAVPQSFREVIG